MLRGSAQDRAHRRVVGNEFVRWFAFYRHAGNYRDPGDRRQFGVDHRESCAFEIRGDRSFGGPRSAVKVRGPRFAFEE